MKNTVFAYRFRFAKSKRFGKSDSPEADRATLLTIAAQCPYMGGDAVFKARALCALFDDGAYNDAALCAAQSVLWRVQHPKNKANTTTELTIKVYPNPSTSIIFIDMSEVVDNEVVTVIDMLGRVLHAETLHDRQNMLQLDLPNGIYLLRIADNSHSISNQKIIINKP